MKNKFKILAFTLLIALFSQCSPTTEEALDYNDKLIEDETKIMNVITALEEVMTTFNPTKINIVMSDAKRQLGISRASLEEMGDFDGDTEFYDATMALYDMFDSQLNTEYKLQYKICKDNVGNINQEQLLQLGQLQKQIDESYNFVFGKFLSAQKNFAEKWKFEVAKAD